MSLNSASQYSNVTVASLMSCVSDLAAGMILAIVDSLTNHWPTLHECSLIFKTERTFLLLHIWTTFEAFITIVVFVIGDCSCIQTIVG